MPRRTTEQNNEIDRFFEQEIEPKRAQYIGPHLVAGSLTWKDQVKLGQEKFPDLDPRFAWSDITNALSRRRLRSTTDS